MILYIGDKLSKHGYTPTSVETLGILLTEKFHIVSVSDKKNKLFRLLDMCFSIVKNRKNLSVILIDTYSTSNFYYALICAWIAKILRIPYIPILRGGNLPLRLKRSPKMTSFLFSNAVVNIAPSGYLFEEFVKKGYQTQFIPNNINIKKYLYRQREKIKPKLLYVRAFSQVYNPTLAVKVLHHLLDIYPNAELCMVGPDKDGTLQDVIDLAQKLRIEDRIKITGKMEKEEWIALSINYDIFINTTNFDNTPVSVMEAMALGLPVVSTNVGGVPYLITDGEDGLLVEKNDVEAMCEKIVDLVQNPETAKKLSIAARKKVESFDWENVKVQWVELINKQVMES